ncbi:MAG: hypothetical protein EON54_23460 [Alcaligenaceae bacterium]|nr:MAG: hypothetical protein EON54_23460 [Alcaligenaceae bacterium]
MRLRKCSDVLLVDGVYFELVDEFDETILDIHRNKDSEVDVSIGARAFNLDSLVAALIEAKTRLNGDIDL